jgi:hypothetical protein
VFNGVLLHSKTAIENIVNSNLNLQVINGYYFRTVMLLRKKHYPHFA